MDINNGTDFGTIKILTLKGEKGDQGEAGVSGDYSGLTNKPSINNVALSGNKSGSDLGLATETAVQQAMQDASDALSATSIIGTGTLDTQAQTLIPAVNEINDKVSVVDGELSFGTNYFTPTLDSSVVRKQGNIVYLNLVGVATQAWSGSHIMATLPEGFRPTELTTGVIYIGASMYLVNIATEGYVQTTASTGAVSQNANIRLSICFIIGEGE